LKTKLSAAAAFACALSTSAFAADLPSRKAAPVYVPPPPPVLWTGFYVGLNAGGTWDATSSTTISSSGYVVPGLFASTPTGLAAAATANGVFGTAASGFIGGGQVGYNWQFAPAWVVGLEADIQGTTAQGTGNLSNAIFVPQSPATVTTTLSATKSLDYLGTVRGRIGYLITPTLLFYGTGGLAYGGANASGQIFGLLTPPNYVPPFANAWSTAGSYSDTRAGWTAGGGVEWMFLPNWSAKVEYLYYDLGSVTTNLGTLSNSWAAPNFVAFAFLSQSTTRFDGHIVRAGVNYHFNWAPPAPVVAKY